MDVTERGDVDAALAQSAIVFEQQFQTQTVEVAFLDAAGKRVTVGPGYEHFRE